MLNTTAKILRVQTSISRHSQPIKILLQRDIAKCEKGIPFTFRIQN